MKKIKTLIRWTMTVLLILAGCYCLFTGCKYIYDSYPQTLESTRCIGVKAIEIDGKTDLYAMSIDANRGVNTIYLNRLDDCDAFDRYRDDILPHTWYNWVALVIGVLMTIIAAAIAVIAIGLGAICGVCKFIQELIVDWINSGEDNDRYED